MNCHKPIAGVSALSRGSICVAFGLSSTESQASTDCVQQLLSEIAILRESLLVSRFLIVLLKSCLG